MGTAKQEELQRLHQEWSGEVLGEVAGDRGVAQRGSQRGCLEGAKVGQRLSWGCPADLGRKEGGKGGGGVLGWGGVRALELRRGQGCRWEPRAWEPGLWGCLQMVAGPTQHGVYATCPEN